ncbi:MAG: transposase, partial [Bacteroidetes bacterium]
MMTRYHRRSIRLKGYDYTQPGAYFITICTHRRAPLFGRVVDGAMVLNEYGEAAQACWDEIPTHFPHVELDAYVVMPNHIHGILWITDVGARHAVPQQHAVPQHAVPPHGPIEQFGKPVPGSIPTIVRSFKSAVTRRINILRG